MVKTGDSRLRTSGEALTLGLLGVIKEDLESGILSDAETLSTLLSTVDPGNGTVSKESSFNHTTTLRHRVHLPSRVGIKGLHATAGWVTRGSDVLVGATTTDDDVWVPVVSAGKGHHNRTTSVGVCAVASGKVWKRANNVASVDVEDLGRLGDLNE